MMTVHSTAAKERVLRREAQAWLLCLTSGKVTPRDAEAFRAWCSLSQGHAQAFADARALWQALGPAAEALQQRAGPESPTAASSRLLGRRAFLGGAVAVSAACLIARPPFGLWSSWSDRVADYHTGTGEQRQVELANGVTIEMNTQTAINLLGRDGGLHMELVSGEAQILTNAQLVRPFTITAGGGKVIAEASTQCNVRCTGSDAQVICVHGQTQLVYRDHGTMVQPDHLVRYGGQAIQPAVAVDPQVAMAWRRRVLIFDNRPLSEVVEEINRYRPGKIVLMDDALAARKVQARFSLAQLADVATLIHDAYGAHVTSLPGGIVLLS